MKDWDQFSGNIKIKRKNNILGNLELELRTGKMSSNNNSNRFVPDIIYIWYRKCI